VVSVLKLGPPARDEATSTDLNPETHTIGAIVTFRFPARGELPPVKLTNDRIRHRRERKYPGAAIRCRYFRGPATSC
jgi:hypothetical protein